MSRPIRERPCIAVNSERLCVSQSRCHSEKLKFDASHKRDEYRAALELIAAPMRPDGTWNRDREACRQLAEKALKGESK